MLCNTFLEAKCSRIEPKEYKDILRNFLLEFYNFIYCIQPFRMCDLVLIRELPYEYANNSLGKNPS